jgi:hypothetical protein
MHVLKIIGIDLTAVWPNSPVPANTVFPAPDNIDDS